MFLAPDKSVELLTRIVGVTRVQTQPQAAAALAQHCGHLPLALRIAVGRLIARPHWSVQQMAERLGDESHRLDELRHGDLARIMMSITLTYESTSEEARRLFRRLALLDMPLLTVWLSSALLDVPVSTAEDLLGDLVAAQLIEIAGNESGVHSHYRFHDLIRVFARERLAAEEPAVERRAALERALGTLLYLADEARRRYYGGDFGWFQSDAPRWPLPTHVTKALVMDPLSWYEHERSALISGGAASRPGRVR